MAPTAELSYSIKRLFRARNGTVGITILTPLLQFFSTISFSLAAAIQQTARAVSRATTLSSFSASENRALFLLLVSVSPGSDPSALLTGSG